MTGALLRDDTNGTMTFGDIAVRRLGFGAMRLTWKWVKGGDRVKDRADAIHLLRMVAERGVNLFDTANIYGLGKSEELIAEALHPYEGLLIATKAGYLTRGLLPGETVLPAEGQPHRIIEECDKSLKRLRIDTIDVMQVHTPDPNVPWEETLGAFVQLQQQGKIRHIGLSNVNVEQIREAQKMCTVVSVQNRFNVGIRTSDPVLELCEKENIAFMPYSPISLDDATTRRIASVAQQHGASSQQVALAWLLQKSPVMTPIPGTSSVDHAHENIDAAWVKLSDADMATIEGSQK